MSEPPNTNPNLDPRQGFRFRCFLWIGVVGGTIVISTIAYVFARDWDTILVGAFMVMLLLICWPIN